MRDTTEADHQTGNVDSAAASKLSVEANTSASVRKGLPQSSLISDRHVAEDQPHIHRLTELLARTQVITSSFGDLSNMMKQIGQRQGIDRALLMHELTWQLRDSNIHLVPAMSEIDRIDIRKEPGQYEVWRFHKQDYDCDRRTKTGFTEVEIDFKGNVLAASRSDWTSQTVVDIDAKTAAREMSISIRMLHAMRCFRNGETARAEKSINECLDEVYKTNQDNGVRRAIELAREQSVGLGVHMSVPKNDTDGGPSTSFKLSFPARRWIETDDDPNAERNLTIRYRKPMK